MGWGMAGWGGARLGGVVPSDDASDGFFSLSSACTVTSSQSMALAESKTTLTLSRKGGKKKAAVRSAQPRMYRTAVHLIELSMDTHNQLELILTRAKHD